MSFLGSALREAKANAWIAFVRPSPLSLGAYGSHVPALIACAAIIKPRRVLELGCGLYSTPLFLDSNYWPTLEEITSIETDGQWLQRVASLHGHDPRWKSQLVDTTMAKWLSSAANNLDIDRCDLIFVDDSANAVPRALTLKAILSRNPGCPIVLHDVEWWRLRRWIWARRRYVIFDAFTPQTGVCNCGAVTLRLLKRANAALHASRDEALTTGSVEEWASLGRAAVQRLGSQGI